METIDSISTKKGEKLENNNNTNSLYIYPNPANESVEIINLNLDNQIVKNEILTTMGQLLKTDYVSNEPIKINLKNLEAGIYLIKTYFNNGDVKTNKIIIK
ncbi:MAG: T9SS type A sorting domain-containing protein [Bacteroidales bacterium]|nr:T9SS type A sorting domain-containing protein [Bacteroidales bacterium]